MTAPLAGEHNFAYDDENELISVWQTNVWREDYVYDGKLRRRITRQFTWNGSGWQLTNEVHYVYDGNVVIQERDQNNLPVVTYTRGVDLSGSLQGAGGIGGLLARTDMGRLTVNDPLASAYYHADGNGNITALITGLMDTNQVLVAKYLYDPYGNLLAESGPLAGANKYRFSSKEWDSPAGLYYYLYRFYDPNLQRWLNRGPIHEWGGWNLYAFVANNPISFGDLFGLWGGEGDSNPTGVNGPPDLTICSSNGGKGPLIISNNDSGSIIGLGIVAGGALLAVGGVGVILSGLDGPDEVAGGTITKIPIKFEPTEPPTEVPVKTSPTAPPRGGPVEPPSLGGGRPSPEPPNAGPGTPPWSNN